jgi:pyruvate-ferredoxin/flavodoxin oxidoreductase
VRARLPARGDPREGLRRSALASAPQTFKSTPYKGNEHKGKQFTIQVAPEDCTGCNLCVNVCPAKDRTNPKHKAIDMHPQAPLREPSAPTTTSS